jgi:signal transduction histidine kinase
MEFNPLDPDLLALQSLIKSLPKVVETKINLSTMFKTIRQKMNQGLFYQDILDFVFTSLDEIIPYDRIGIALLEEDGTRIRLNWVRSKLEINALRKDYAASMHNSSLQVLIDSGEPRIIEDLEAYLVLHPGSASTRLAVDDGVRSSLTCPLVLDGSPLGVIFFSSSTRNTYGEAHVEIFCEIASGLALIIEQGLNKKTRQLLGSKEKIFRDTIHDLNNPLSVIQLTLDMVARKKWFQELPEDSKKSFAILRRNCEAMVNLTHDLTYAQKNLDTEKPLDLVAHPLENFLSEVLADSEIMARRKKMTVRLLKEPNLPDSAVLDPGKIKECIENFISNGVKYSREGSELLIHVSVNTNGKRLCVTVTDQGQGIPNSEIPILFTEFGTTSVRPTANEPSRGLGLANVRRVILAHSGDVFVTSVVNVGSVFGFWIPLD